MQKNKTKKFDLKTLLILALSYIKVGLFTFGGGLAMIALLQHEYVEKKKWIEKEEFEDIVAIAESTPGPIAINCATYIGYKVWGVIGSIVATISVCIPSFTIIYVISLFFDAFMSFEIVQYAFKGIQVGVIFLILSAGFKFFNGMKKNLFNILVFACSFGCMLAFGFFAVDFSSIFLILLGGGFGLIVYFVGLVVKKNKKEVE